MTMKDDIQRLLSIALAAFAAGFLLRAFGAPFWGAVAFATVFGFLIDIQWRISK